MKMMQLNIVRWLYSTRSKAAIEQMTDTFYLDNEDRQDGRSSRNSFVKAIQELSTQVDELKSELLAQQKENRKWHKQ
jgi:hypothetical protein